METQLVAEFVSKTGSSPDDALSCLKTWGWDLKKALIDYNGKTNSSPLYLLHLHTNEIESNSLESNINCSLCCRHIDNRVF